MAGSRSGRRRGETQTRKAILEVARRHFAEYGYRGVTIRGIARDAGVDPALIHHFYGRKLQLFEAALELAITEATGPGDRAAQQPTAGRMLARWQDPEQRRRFLVIVRAVVNEPETVPLVRRTMQRELMPPGATEPTAAAQLDAALLGVRTIGMALLRHVVGLPALVAEDTGRLVQLLDAGSTATAAEAVAGELPARH